jgi:hypothetical protein
MHITDTLGRLLGGRSRRAVAMLIVAFCATLALTISTPGPASAAPTADTSSLPDLASARGTSTVVPSGKANRGQFSMRTDKSGTRVAGYALVHIWNCYVRPLNIFLRDHTGGGGWQYRQTIWRGCGGEPGLTLSLQDGHTYSVVAVDSATGAVRAGLDHIPGGTTHVGYWTIY